MKLAETTSCCSWLLVLRYVHTHSMVHIHSVVQPLPGSGWEGWLQQPNPAAATTVATAATERLQPLPLHLPKKASPLCHQHPHVCQHGLARLGCSVQQQAFDVW